MEAAAAQRLWEATYADAGRQHSGGAGARLRRISLLGGLVLPVWDAVQVALDQQMRPSDRKLSVLRLQTTGAALLVLISARLCLSSGQRLTSAHVAHEQADQSSDDVR